MPDFRCGFFVRVVTLRRWSYTFSCNRFLLQIYKGFCTKILHFDAFLKGGKGVWGKGAPSPSPDAANPRNRPRLSDIT